MTNRSNRGSEKPRGPGASCALKRAGIRSTNFVRAAVEPQHAQDLLGRCPPVCRSGDRASPPGPHYATARACPERPLRDPQHLRRFLLRQLAPLMPLEQPLETRLPNPFSTPPETSPAPFSSGSKRL